jgi:hypothetical protein
MSTPRFVGGFSLVNSDRPYRQTASSSLHSTGRTVTPQYLIVRGDIGDCRECCFSGTGICWTRCPGDRHPM